MRLGRHLFYATIAAATMGQIALAQVPAGVIRQRSNASRAVASAVEANGGGAFVVEALAGSLGSLAGIGIVGLTAGCGHEDLRCVILRVGAGGAVGALGAVIGTELAAGYTGSKRSIVGAALGAVVGTGVGLGVHALVDRNSDRNLGDPVVVPIFVISQGTFAAIGSRMLGGAR